ncbi:hypothetical protein N7532_011083 [Penicillium argentinense]|uniref:Uncharacterized protein n=1 Tax=Penicillium argentinense TaxID=1131581 RepID=A0A9W9EHW0_9EURO|nr:uncharacterized protein N7532_011083 [Penicillium argentinense]KAJ5082040.1 hypothetical protein N7532_011083 [Penicillium argentinense]
MLSLPFRLRRGLFGANRDEENNSDDGSSSSSQPEQSTEKEVAKDFFPSLWDVLKVRYLLQWKIRKGLPPELVDAVIDAAEYWPSTVHEMEGKRRVMCDRDQVLLKTVPLCYDRKVCLAPLWFSSAVWRLTSRDQNPNHSPHRTVHPCRKIVFHLSSHDQGGGRAREDMYHGSWTWFDTEVIREAHTKKMYVDGTEQEILEDELGYVKKHFEPSDQLLSPRSKQVQMNGARVSEMQDRVITWHYLDDVAANSTEAYHIERTEGRGRLMLDGHVVRELQVGDSIALWGRARFTGWANYVDRASVRIFWAV